MNSPREPMRPWVAPILLLCLWGLAGCDDGPWNDPYPASEAGRAIYYSAFTERPKHLDPARSYSANEYQFIAQIYEPPLQYHFLLRPYRLVPRTLERVPAPRYLNAAGEPLPPDAPEAEVAFTDYLLQLRPGIHYQPHPAFARDAQGGYLYYPLAPGIRDGLHSPADLPVTGTRELTAADYAYEIKRLAVPWLHSPIAGLMGEHIQGFADFSERVRGLRPRPGEWLDLREIPMRGVRVEGRYRLRIRIRGKYRQFLYWLAMPFFAPMPWEADRFYAQPGLKERNISLDWFPVGTGPYRLTENNPNLRMVLERNPHFHRETYPAEGMPGDRAAGLLADAGRPLPFVDKAVYSLEKENIPYWNKFLQGYYDASGIGSDSFDQAIRFGAGGEARLTPALKAKGIRLTTAVTTSIYYFGFNMKDPVVGGYGRRARLLRRAVAIALDYEEYISIFANGRGRVAQGPIPPGIFGYREGEAGIDPYVYTWAGGRAQRRSIAEARALLARAGYPGGRDPATGRPLVLYYDTPASGPDGKARLAWMRKQFARLGIQLVVRASDYNRFQEKMRKGTAQTFSWGWNADYPDPENFLFLLYGPNGKVDHGGENAANYARPEFDRLFERMRNLDDGPERQALIDRMLEIARRDAPWAWGYYPVAYSLSHAWLGNAKPNLMANDTLKYRRIDPRLRAASRRAWNPPLLWPLGLALAALVAALLPALRLYRRRERETAR